MPGPMGDYVGRLQTNVRARIDSVTKSAVDEFRNDGAVAMLLGLGERFGKNNRALIGR